MRIAFIGKEGPDSHIRDIVIDAIGSRARLETIACGHGTAEDRYVHALGALTHDRFDGLIYIHDEMLACRLAPHDFAPSFVVPTPMASDKVAIWRSLVDCHFLCFDRRSHETLQRNGCRTSHFQPFPGPGDGGEVSASQETEGALYIGEATDTATVALVDRQCRAIGITRLWVNSIAPAGSATARALAALPYAVIIDADDRPRLGSARFRLVPPEEAAASLEYVGAMPRGQVVVATASSVAADYVTHLATGILTCDEGRPLTSPMPDGDRFWEIGRAARVKASNGARDWWIDKQRLASIILRDGRRWSTTDISSHFATLIRQRAHERITCAI